jgi:hypothetical protein
MKTTLNTFFLVAGSTGAAILTIGEPCFFVVQIKIPAQKFRDELSLNVNGSS